MDILKDLKAFATKRIEELATSLRAARSNKGTPLFHKHIQSFISNFYPDKAVGPLPSHIDHTIPHQLLNRPDSPRRTDPEAYSEDEDEPSNPPNIRPVSAPLAGIIPGKNQRLILMNPSLNIKPSPCKLGKILTPENLISYPNFCARGSQC